MNCIFKCLWLAYFVSLGDLTVWWVCIYIRLHSDYFCFSCLDYLNQGHITQRDTHSNTFAVNFKQCYVKLCSFGWRENFSARSFRSWKCAGCQCKELLLRLFCKWTIVQSLTTSTFRVLFLNYYFPLYKPYLCDILTILHYDLQLSFSKQVDIQWCIVSYSCKWETSGAESQNTVNWQKF